MSETPKRTPGCGAFTAASIVGLFFGFSFFTGIMLGECWPRDGSAEMRVCDAAKGLGFTAFPLILLACFAAAGVAAWRGKRWLGIALTAGAPFLSLAILFVLQRIML